MLDEKIIREIKENAEKNIRAGEIIKSGKGEFSNFFLNNSKNSLETAKLPLDASTNPDLKRILGVPDFNGFLWVINSSYYSMFYMARALLENFGIKLESEQSVHFITFNALFYYFYLNGKLERSFIEDFKEAGEEASEILGKEKAKNIIEDYMDEKSKRAKFTYEIGEIAMRNKAETSLKRAKRFNEEIRKILIL